MWQPVSVPSYFQVEGKLLSLIPKNIYDKQQRSLSLSKKSFDLLSYFSWANLQFKNTSKIALFYHFYLFRMTENSKIHNTGNIFEA